MSLVGLGRAFNLRYRPNGPLRFNCYQRQMPTIFGGGNYSYTENINIQQGPSGFWGFMSGLTQGYFGMSALLGGGLFGGGGGLFGILNSKQQGVTDPTATAGEDKYLKSLTQVLGAKGTFAKHPDKENIYIMTTKDGKVIEDTYQNLIDKFKEEPLKDPDALKQGDGKKTEAELKAEHENKDGVEQPEQKAKEEAAGKSNAAGAPVGNRRTNKTNRANGAKGAEGPKKTQDSKSNNYTMTKAEYAQARRRGAEVADNLVGYTDSKEQENTARIIKNDITNKNVTAFLNGYNANRRDGDKFFTQLASEWDFKEKDELCKNIATKLLQYCKNSGQTDVASKIETLIKAGRYQEIDNLLPQIKAYVK